jgi:hypothetical protein
MGLVEKELKRVAPGWLPYAHHQPAMSPLQRSILKSVSPGRKPRANHISPFQGFKQPLGHGLSGLLFSPQENHIMLYFGR